METVHLVHDLLAFCSFKQLFLLLINFLLFSAINNQPPLSCLLELTHFCCCEMHTDLFLSFELQMNNSQCTYAEFYPSRKAGWSLGKGKGEKSKSFIGGAYSLQLALILPDK